VRDAPGHLNSTVRIGGRIFPLRTAVVRGVGLVPYPWSEEKEQAFQRWWATEGRKRIGRHPSPDDDKNDSWDARAAWFFGFRNVSSRGVEYLPPVRTTNERRIVPEQKVDVWTR
jgi:hypothetical protein